MRFSANIQELKPSATIAVSTLAKQLKAEGRNILNLGAGEPDFRTPEFISSGGIDGIKAGRTRYTPPAGLPELRQAIAHRLCEQAGRELDWNGVVVTAGAKQALFNAIFSLFGPGDEVLVAAPYWTTYPDLVTLARGEPKAVFGSENRDFKVTPSDLDDALTGRTRGLILNSPSNPTGAVYSLSELSAIAGWAKEREVWLIVDEIYRRIYHEDSGDAPGLLDLPAEGLPDFVLIDGASKSFAMTGWRVGYSFSPTELARKMTALQSQTTSNVSTPAQMAALRAYGEPEAADASIAEMGIAFARRRDLATNLFEELLPQVRYVRPKGAFYLFFRSDALGTESATEWCGKLLSGEGVALVPGAAFGDDRWSRMSFAAEDSVIEEAIRRIARMAAS